MFSSKGKGSFLLMVSIILLLAGNRATAAEIQKISSIQHVYVDDEFIGSVSDESEIEKMILAKIVEAEADYPEYTFDKEAQMTYVQENVFNAEIDDEETLKVLEEEFAVKAEAYEIAIDNQVVAYVPSKEDAQEVLKEIHLLYIDEGELAEYEESQEAGVLNQPMALYEQGSRILSIEYSKPISWKETIMEPDKLMTVKDAISLIEKGKMEKVIYEATGDEELEEIADQYDMSLGQLLQLNSELEEGKRLHKGQKVRVTEVAPFVNVLVEREVLKETEIPFERKVIKDKNLLKEESVVEQEGQEGVQAFTYKLTETNGELLSETIVKKEITAATQNEITRKGTKIIPSEGSGTFAWPADGGYISSKQGHRWGKLHKGIDIARPTTRTITAADHGTVEFAGNAGGYGNKVTINHNNGYKTDYAHLESIDIEAGQKIEKGMPIGRMGSTGNSTGVHLHFEIYKNGVLANPLDYISQ
ncbi:peptidoglycan DD-metalloendopeptidase family protein [Peribacillus sp. NPDC097284]|uniref:peptidoglycan DD-metalloendopeptidase family protein n=1 Tax=Peribacillus sp. NPDC097284 TaxID=3364401 RepID=UPI0038167EE1